MISVKLKISFPTNSIVSFLISLSIIFSIPNAISPTYTGANLTEAPAKGITGNKFINFANVFVKSF